MNTATFAEALGIKPETLLKAISSKGSYFGVIPTKQANGRLVWPASEVQRLKGGA
jgi:hypothetical protein